MRLILSKSSWLADIFGLAMLALQFWILFRYFAPADDSGIFAGLLAYAVLATTALYLWHAEKMVRSVSTPSGWARVIGGSVFAAALSFGCDMIVGTLSHPHLSAVEAAMKTGSPFGFALTLMLCPGLTTVGISGFLRSVLVEAV